MAFSVVWDNKYVIDVYQNILARKARFSNTKEIVHTIQKPYQLPYLSVEKIRCSIQHNKFNYPWYVPQRRVYVKSTTSLFTTYKASLWKFPVAKKDISPGFYGLGQACNIVSYVRVSDSLLDTGVSYDNATMSTCQSICQSARYWSILWQRHI